ncbi:MAG: alpha/beta hydrolase [Thermoplasmata archaeon]
MASHTPSPIPLNTRISGQGSPVILIHGVGEDLTVWDGVQPLLAPDTRSIAVDLRGHGGTASPTGSTFSFAEIQDDLTALYTHHELSNAHVVGLGAGGFVALRLALEQPDRVRSLTLVGAASHCDQHTKAVIDRWAETYREEGFDAYYLRRLKDLYYPDWIEAHLDLADELRDRVRGQNYDAIWAWAAVVKTFDLRSHIHRIKLPTLAIQALDDQVIDPSHGRLLRQSIFGTELKLFPETGHLAPVERPERTAEAIQTFVRAVDAKIAAASKAPPNAPGVPPGAPA